MFYFTVVINAIPSKLLPMNTEVFSAQRFLAYYYVLIMMCFTVALMTVDTKLLHAHVMTSTCAKINRTNNLLSAP